MVEIIGNYFCESHDCTSKAVKDTKAMINLIVINDVACTMFIDVCCSQKRKWQEFWFIDDHTEPCLHVIRCSK